MANQNMEDLDKQFATIRLMMHEFAQKKREEGDSDNHGLIRSDLDIFVKYVDEFFEEYFEELKKGDG